MPFVTGSGLGGAVGTPSSVIEAIRAEIDSKMTGVKGVDWIERRYTGSVGGADREYWVEIPAAKTVNGRTLIVGFAELAYNEGGGTDTNRLVINTSHLSWTNMTTGVGAGTFLRMDGQPSDRLTNPDDGDQDAQVPSATLLVSGSASIRHWIITSTGFGTDAPSDELSLFFVVEISTGRFISIGFGELVQFGDWSADANDGNAGGWVAATTVSNWNDTGLPSSGLHDDNNYLLWGAYARNVSTGARDAFSYADCVYVPHSQTAKYGSNVSPWGRIGSHQSTIEAASAVIAPISPDILLQDHMSRAASAATGIAQRLPVRLYLGDRGDNAPLNALPIGDVPNVFYVNIGNLNPGSQENFSGEDFLIIPYLQKNSGSIDTGNRGYLFRL